MNKIIIANWKAHPDTLAEAQALFETETEAAAKYPNIKTVICPPAEFVKELGANGTQDIFYSTNKVLYLSMHQFPAYPGTGWLEEIGMEKGKGFTINIPMPPYTGDDLFLQILNEFIPKIKNGFNPDVVAVSAGFDGHHSDPLLQLNLTATAYYETGKLLSKNFKNIFACLEGGYNLEFLHKNIIDFVNGINNKSQEFKEESAKSDNDVINDFKLRTIILKENLKKYWNFNA